MSTSGLPRRPREALSEEAFQRFIYSCSHERRSPTTHRLVDASTYGWIHLFIRDNSGEEDVVDVDADWLDPQDADPAKLEAYFGRVAIRLRDTSAADYATSLQRHFKEMAETR